MSDPNGRPDPQDPSDLIPNGGDTNNPNEYGGNHETIYDRNRGQHISWDNDRNGDYVPDSGHTRDDRNHRTINDWDRSGG